MTMYLLTSVPIVSKWMFTFISVHQDPSSYACSGYNLLLPAHLRGSEEHSQRKGIHFDCTHLAWQHVAPHTDDGRRTTDRIELIDEIKWIEYITNRVNIYICILKNTSIFYVYLSISIPTMRMIQSIQTIRRTRRLADSDASFSCP